MKLRPKSKRRAPSLTRADLLTPKGRRRAWLGLIFADHGFLRYIYSNIHEISPRMRRSYQPAPLHVRKFAEQGVRTIINLRGESGTGYYLLEQEACEKEGIDFHAFRVFSRDAPSKEMLHGARDLFEKIQYPAVIHCKSGSDRVGLMSTLFLFLYEQRPLEEAQQQLSLRFGHIKAGKTGILDAFFDAYRSYNAQTPTPFFDWVDTVYDPVELKANFKPTGFGDFLVDTVLRRE